MSDETGRRASLKNIREPLPVATGALGQDTTELYEFGLFRLEPAERKLLRNNEPVVLTPKAFDTLVLLVRNNGHLLEKDELIRTLWPDSFVEEGNLSNNIFVLRKALGEDPPYIETIPKRGYRFVGDVHRLPTPPPRVSHVAAKPTEMVPLTVVLAIALATVLGLVIYSQHLFVRHSGPTIQSVAVLPLTNLSSDAGQDYFADGMTEELTTELGSIAALRVASRTSAMQYKDAKKPLSQIARELNVDALLEGTVMRSGNRAHITLNLIQPSPERHLWTQTYDTDAGDILNVEQRVADSVAKEMRVALASRDPGVVPARHSVNLEAQDFYFRGLHALRSAAGAGRSAIHYFQQAIEKDPNYAKAYCGLAMAYATWYPDDPGPREKMPKAREAAQKAVALEGSLSGAHMALAYVELNYDWNWAEAESEFQRTLQLDPNNAIARNFYARELVALGRTDEGLAQATRALEIDPYWGLDYSAWVFYLAHRYEDSLQLAQKLVSMDPNAAWGHWWLAANYEQLGKPKEASEEYLKFETLSGSDAPRIQRLQEGLASRGVKGFWQASLDDYQETAKSKHAPPVMVAGACARLGDKECAFQWLAKGLEERDDLMVDLKVDPVLDGIRGDPRFQDLIRRVGLP